MEVISKKHSLKSQLFKGLLSLFLSYTNNSKREDLLCVEFFEQSLVVEVLMLWGLSIRANFRNVRKSRAVSGYGRNL